MTKARIENYNGYPAFVIDGKVYPPMAATIRTIQFDNVCIDEDYYRELGKSGIKIFFLICDTLWLMPNALEVFSREAEILLKVCPDAYIIPRISLHPPQKWIEDNPDEIVSYSDGSQIKTLLYMETFKREMNGMYSLASQKWREDAGRALIETVKEIEKLPYADRIVGYFFAAGGTSEWYYINPIENFETCAYADTSKAFSKEFQKFLDKKYGQGKVQAEIPGIETRFFAEKLDEIIANPPRLYATSPEPEPPCNGTNFGSFLDVNRYMHTADFYRAWHLATAESVVYFAKLLKDRNPDLITGSFYGSWGWSEIIWASNTAGVLKILDSGYVDMLANPGVYENRQPGGFTGQRQMADSFRLRNTIYMVEEDTRTHAENRHFGDLAKMYTMEDTINVLKRDFARNICEDLQAWWFDQHVGGGRYKFPEVYRLFERQQEIAREAYEKDRRKGSEIAFIYDEESVHIVSKQTTVETVELVRGYEIARIGAPVDQYFHNDMSNPDMPDYKLYVFFNTYSLTNEERRAIKDKLAKNHAVALFMYAPGIINPSLKKPLDIKNISDFTEIECRAVNEKFSPKFSVIKGSHKIADALEENRIYGFFDRVEKNNISFVPRHTAQSYLYPVIYSDDRDAVVAARFKANNYPAVTVKETGCFTSILCGSKFINADFLRETARFAGCHIYEEDGNVLYANKNYIAVHASKTGEITITLPETSNVTEVYERKCYAKGADRFSFHMVRGTTKMFEVKGI